MVFVDEAAVAEAFLLASLYPYLSRLADHGGSVLYPQLPDSPWWRIQSEHRTPDREHPHQLEFLAHRRPHLLVHPGLCHFNYRRHTGSSPPS